VVSHSSQAGDGHRSSALVLDNGTMGKLSVGKPQSARYWQATPLQDEDNCLEKAGIYKPGTGRSEDAGTLVLARGRSVVGLLLMMGRGGERE